MKARREGTRRAIGTPGYLFVALLSLVVCTVLGSSFPAVAAEPAGPAGDPVAAGGVTITVRLLEFTGAAHLLTAAEQEALRAAAIGRDLDFAGLQALADRATLMLQEKGRLLAFAYLPPQDVTEGRVEIALAEGVVEGWQFELGEGARIRPQRLEAIAHAAARPGESLTRQGLERALLLMGDLAGGRARAVLQRGEAPNTTRVVVTAGEGRSTTGSLTLDNHGIRATGVLQATATANLNGLLGMGERLEVTGVVAEGMRTLRLGGSVIVSGSGLKLGGRVSSTATTVVDGPGASVDMRGESTLWRLSLEYPLARSRTYNLWGNAAFSQRASSDSLAGIVYRESYVRTASLGVSGDAADPIRRSQVSWEATVTAGATGEEDLPSRFVKVEYSLQRQQRLSGPWSWSARVRGQWSGANLGSSEKFALGGPSGVRAYPGSEGSGDHGAVAAVELHYDVPLAASPLQLTAFLDAGWVRLYHDPPAAIPTISGKNTYTLAGAGFSAKWRAGSSLSLEAGWAQALGENPGQTIFGTNADGTTGRSRLWIQARLTF